MAASGESLLAVGSSAETQDNVGPHMVMQNKCARVRVLFNKATASMICDPLIHEWINLFMKVEPRDPVTSQRFLLQIPLA